MTDDCESELFEILIGFLEDLRCVDIEAIESDGEIIGIECEMVWLVGLGCEINRFIHASEDLYEGFVMIRQPTLVVILSEMKNPCLMVSGSFTLFRMTDTIRITDLSGSHIGILDIRSGVPFEIQCLVPIECHIFLSILCEVGILDCSDRDSFDILIRESTSFFFEYFSSSLESFLYERFEKYHGSMTCRHRSFFELDEAIESMEYFNLFREFWPCHRGDSEGLSEMQLLADINRIDNLLRIPAICETILDSREIRGEIESCAILFLEYT